ncbi:MAG TPA: energy transducer TonB [Pedobacter sp.]|jgi:antitoxin component YwqK of YwqJK toxin-antitoxin module
MKTFLITFLSVLANFCYSQKAQNIYYFKGNEIPVKTKEEAEYIRVIQEPDSGSVLYNLLEFYSDNTKKTLGTVSKFEPKLVYEGQVVTFYNNGKKRDIGNYKNGDQLGDRFEYYKNGHLKKRGTYEKLDKQILLPGELKPTIAKYKLWDYFDSTGVQLVKDGNGIYKSNKNDSEIIEEGAYKDGVKDGQWTGEYPKYSASFDERYENGKLVFGKAKLADGSITEYTSEEVMPQFKGGIQKFYSYVQRAFRYPVYFQQRGVTGMVVISFVVQTDGTLSEVKVIRDLGHGTGEEAMRVVRSSPKWTPGLQHGIPVKVFYTLPLSLNLQVLGPTKY